MRASRRLAILVPILLAAAANLQAQADHRALEREILKELIEIDTSDAAHRTGEAARAMARRLVAAGLPAADVQVVSVKPGYESLVARYRGAGGGRRPILLMAHLDVVEALKEDWSFDPFQFRELEGYYYGRGASDNKAGAAMLVANFIRYKQEGFVPRRDLIVVLTADEETTGDAIKGLLERHRALVDADFALNTDGGGGELRDGKPVAFAVQTAEKVYLTFQLETRNKGGHSSLPVPDNAIYRLSEGLTRLARFTFPVRLNETTRTFFERASAAQPPEIARDMQAVARSGDEAAAARLSALVPYYNSVMRTTCVATRLFAGHADNALPQLARATVNCRMLPGDPADAVEAELKRVVAEPQIEFTRVQPPVPSPPSPLRPDVMGPLEKLVARMWPGAAVVPEMSTGATDGLYTRGAGIPTYGVGGIFERIDDVRAHGRDERVGVQAFHDAAQFWYELVKALA